jgi:hypothetical protein
MTKEEFKRGLEAIREERKRLESKEKELKQRYADEVMERNGFHVGDRVDDGGRSMMVVGSEYGYVFHLLGARIKKDGTPYNERQILFSVQCKEE